MYIQIKITIYTYLYVIYRTIHNPLEHPVFLFITCKRALNASKKVYKGLH